MATDYCLGKKSSEFINDLKIACMAFLSSPNDFIGDYTLGNYAD